MTSHLTRLWHRLRRTHAGGDSQAGDGRMLPQSGLSGPMPWVIAIMIALTVIVAAGGLALRNAARAASTDVASGVTVQIVSAAPHERNRQASAAAAALRAIPGVVSVRRVGQDELDTLVEPWLGTRPGDDVDALPIPALIDVELTGPALPDRLATLRARLAPVAPEARVDADAGWLSPVLRAMDALQWLSGGLIVLFAGATTATVMLAARNALGSQRETIAIVHLLGGTDRQIARVFQRGAALDAALGGVVGLVAGAVILIVLAGQFAALGLAEGAANPVHAIRTWLGWIDLGVIAAIPLGGIALAIVTARLTVIAALRRML